MDVYCQKCGEPWDVCELADGDPRDKKRFLRGEGCECCGWGRNAPRGFAKSGRAMAMSACADLLGDDVDGMAAMMDDFEYLGVLND